LTDPNVSRTILPVNPLDLMLFDAWHRISREIRQKRIEALRRSRRRFMGVLTRPMRECSLVVRASDTRINDVNAPIEPFEAYRERREHLVTLDAILIRQITKPVDIDWPGVTLHKAAELCGREYKTIKNWVAQGVFQINRYPEHRFPRDGKLCGRPYVWTPTALDVNNFKGRTPHFVWGTLWKWMGEKLPENFQFTVRRVPFFRMFRGKRCFRGWHFICPGRLDVGGEPKGCGRECMYLYAPQTLWTLPRAIDDMSGFDMPEDSGLAGQWVPGEFDASKASGPRSFACKECWYLRSACMANRNGWNEFISHISGGLLYGRDVPRLPEICPVERKKPVYTWRKRRAADAAADAQRRTASAG
jgi:hypothetical protein